MRVRLEGPGLDAVRLSLRAPNGQVVALRDAASPPIEGEVAQLHYPIDGAAAGLSSLEGWQPDGAWTLVVDGPGDTNAAVVDFAVFTHGDTFAHAAAP